MNGLLRHIRVLFGLMVNGPGAADHMYTYTDIGTGQDQDTLGCAEIGNTLAVVTAGTGAIGRNPGPLTPKGGTINIAKSP
jgi:hypothetical protein